MAVADLISGRYKLTESDNFDEFLAAIGTSLLHLSSPPLIANVRFIQAWATSSERLSSPRVRRWKSFKKATKSGASSQVPR